MGNRIEHQPGEKRGRLSYIVEVAPRVHPGGQQTRYARFRCDCGNLTVCSLRDWRRGSTQSCGCWHAEAPRTHGQSGRTGGRGRTPLYSCWANMRTRCTAVYQAKRPSYAGVRCDPRWATFEGFLANQPAGRPFEPGLVLARLGDTGDYTPENTRWATKAENSREMNEVSRMARLPDGRFAADVARENGVSTALLAERVRRYGWDIMDAATRPPRRRRPHGLPLGE